jgi:ammonia channel protein AmtB
MTKPSWQSTLIAALLIGLTGSIFLVVEVKSGIDDALKAWAAIGTLAGVVTGVVPAYFFGQQRAAAAEQAAETAQKEIVEERGLRQQAEDRARLVLGHADPTLIQTLQTKYPQLF